MHASAPRTNRSETTAAARDSVTEIASASPKMDREIWGFNARLGAAPTPSLDSPSPSSIPLCRQPIRRRAALASAVFHQSRGSTLPLCYLLRRLPLIAATAIQLPPPRSFRGAVDDVQSFRQLVADPNAPDSAMRSSWLISPFVFC
jgi:hypothetical protein